MMRKNFLHPLLSSRNHDRNVHDLLDATPLFSLIGRQIIPIDPLLL